MTDLLDDFKNGRAALAVLGLGYVGLPLAIEFGKKVPTVGFDVDARRIEELLAGKDRNHESSADEIRSAKKLEFTADEKKLDDARFFIVAVPTPVTETKEPDLSAVRRASEIVARRLKKGDCVVFEPTVYPGVTEEICVPILEKVSKLRFGTDFKVGYSPERINPGDKARSVSKIVKIVSGSDAEALELVAGVYGLVVEAGVHRAPTIRTAEAAKVIENVQRDLNIALMNELALIFHRLGIDTRSVIEAAGTKWNFHKYYPGLVGGHCIGVDPYYLTHKAEQSGYHPQVILSGRRINDNMGQYVAEQTVKHLIKAGKAVQGSRVVVLGITFKENVADIRNSRVIDLVREFREYGTDVSVCDPHADPEEVRREYGIELVPYAKDLRADALVVAVSHDGLRKELTPARVREHLLSNGGRGVLIDVKGFFNPADFQNGDILFWRL